MSLSEYWSKKRVSRRGMLRAGLTAGIISHPGIRSFYGNRTYELNLLQASRSEDQLTLAIEDAEEYYTRNILTEETARSDLIPLYVQAYNKNSGRQISLEKIQSVLFFGKTPYSEASNSLSSYAVNARTGDVINISIDLDSIPSTGMSRHALSGEFVPNIVIFHSGLFHELNHATPKISKDTDLMPDFLISGTSEPIIRETAYCKGFRPTALLSNSQKYAKNDLMLAFDELGNDVVSSFTTNESGLKYVMTTQGAPAFKVYLYLSTISPERMNDFHKNSTLQQMIIEVGQAALTNSGNTAATREEHFLKGQEIFKFTFLSVLRYRTLGDLAQLASLYPNDPFIQKATQSYVCFP